MTVHTPIETGSRGIPGWALGLTVFVLLVGGVYFAGNLTGENPTIIAHASPSGSGAPVLNAVAIIDVNMPGVDGPATDALYALGANWLKGISVKKIGW